MEALVVVPGNIGQDADVVEMGNGKSVITFSVATNRNYTDDSGEKQQVTQWHECKKFVKEVNQKFVDLLRKGTPVTVIGKLYYSEWKKEIQGEKFQIKSAYIRIDEVNIGKAAAA